MSKRRKTDGLEALPKKRQRDASVYDAVAGRCSTQRFIPSIPYTSRTRDTQTSSTVPIPPDEVLFRRLGAPERDIHNDFYWADRHLNAKQTLPDSDLLKALHTYAADFYAAMQEDGEVMFRSMEETALLALGALMEEAAGEILGKTGDMVFVVAGKTRKPTVAKGHGTAVHDAIAQKLPNDSYHSVDEDNTPLRKSKPKEKRKKRKIQHEEEQPD